MTIAEIANAENKLSEREQKVANAAQSVASGGGRSSAFPELTTSQWVQGLFQSYAGLAYHLPFEILGYIELLSAWNPDFSQAVDNVRSLANSGHNLFIDAPSNRTQMRIKDRLEAKAMSIQSEFGGVDGLIDKLLDQAAVYGAMAGEWIVDEQMTDVIGFIDVNPKHIRFFWDDATDKFAPYQVVNAAQQEKAKERGQEVIGNCVKLNEVTFHYYAFDAAPGSPYGTPPFLAALPNIAIQRDMVANMAQIVKKVGLLGIIDMSIKALPGRPGEGNEAYQVRATSFLKNYVTVVEQMVKDGGIVHFDDATIETQQLTGNAAGATNIFKQNEELIFSGLKSMPSVQGRCLDPNTRILMADGSTKILRDVKVGDLIQAFDEHTGITRRRWQEAKVENVWTVRKNSLRLHLSDGRSVLCSEDHPFLMQKQNSGDQKLDRQTGNVRAREDAARRAAETRWSGQVDEFVGTDWKRASNIRTGEWIKALDEPVLVDYESDDYKCGYLAGANAGDGWTSDRSWHVAVSLPDQEIIDRIEDYLCDLLPTPIYSRRITEPNRNPRGTSFAGTLQMLHIGTARRENVQFLKEIADGRDSDDFKAGWLAGIYDTDGSFDNTRSRGRIGVKICQNDGAVKDRAAQYLGDLGFSISINSKAVCILGDRLEKWRFTATVLPALDRKVVRLEGHTVRTFKPVQVKEIEVVGYRKLIDLTTTTSTLVANGLCSHNSYSSTETYAGVAYDIIIRNTYKYQRAVKRMIEAGYWLMVTFWGETPDAIRLEFMPNKSLHRLQDAQAFRLEIFNAVLLWALGILNQQDVSQKLGYQTPRTIMDTVPDSPLLGPPPTVGLSAKSADDQDQQTAKKLKKVEALVGQIAEALSASGDFDESE